MMTVSSSHSVLPEYNPGLGFSSVPSGSSQTSEDSAVPQLDDPDGDEELFDFDAASHDSSPDFDEFRWSISDSHSLDSTAFHFSSDSEESSDSDSVFLPFAADREQDSDDEGDPETEDDFGDVTEDPLFSSRSSLFDSFQPGSDPGTTGEAEEPWAFDDHPAIRNAYIRAFVGSVFDGMTRNATLNMLNGSRIILQSGAAAGVDYPGLENFATTLPTVEKRLGVSTNTLITYLFLCNVCWKPHFPEELAELQHSDCDQSDCTGTLYTVKRLSGGVEKRTPTLTLPFVPPEKAIQRMCLQPGKVAQWQEWREPRDTVGEREPSPLTGYEAFPDPDKPMTDITDGWG
jgi:hypothetical protein